MRSPLRAHPTARDELRDAPPRPAPFVLRARQRPKPASSSDSMSALAPCARERRRRSRSRAGRALSLARAGGDVTEEPTCAHGRAFARRSSNPATSRVPRPIREPPRPPTTAVARRARGARSKLGLTGRDGQATLAANRRLACPLVCVGFVGWVCGLLGVVPALDPGAWGSWGGWGGSRGLCGRSPGLAVEALFGCSRFLLGACWAG